MTIAGSCYQEKKKLPRETLQNAATIVRTFLEDYHEKQEENYLFPRFQKANQLTDLVEVLLHQHHAGRNITSQVLQLTRSQTGSDTDNQNLVQLFQF